MTPYQQRIQRFATRCFSRNARGFTLVELMIALSIVAIVVTMAVPSFKSLISMTQLRTATSHLVGVLNLARSEAIKRGWPVTVCKSADVGAQAPSCDEGAAWQDGWLVFVDYNQNGIKDADDASLRVGAPESGRIMMTADNNFSDYLTYLPDGASVGSGGSAAGTLSICLDAMQRVVTVSRVGHLRVEAADC
jgi:type IV fimbrial biogenesis protein FimT